MVLNFKISRWETFGLDEWPFVAVFTLWRRRTFIVEKNILEPVCLFIGDIRVLEERDVLMLGA